jgi:manganese/zinc/iron transport system permease protein
MLETAFEFFSFTEPNVRTVTLGTVLLGIGAAVVGSFTYLRKRALVGDAVSHAILPGVALAFMITGEREPLYLLVGALLAGWISLLSIDGIVNYSKLKTDTAIALILSVFFGFGILLLTAIQQQGTGTQAGLDSFLFGKAAGMTTKEVHFFGWVSAALIGIVLLFFNVFRLVSFNREFAISLGLPVRFIEFIMATITVLAITTGIQAVGVVLMAALLITPAAAARPFTNRLEWMIVIAAAIGAVGGLVGSFVSYTHPQMPTGPWIVVVLSFFAVGALLFAPNRGVVASIRRRYQNQRKIRTENLLKAFYQLYESGATSAITKETLQAHRNFQSRERAKGLTELLHRGCLTKESHQYALTEKGLEEGKRIVRLHRLWEVYLTERMRMQADHIHPQAETMEHIITPEIEAQLIKELNTPQKDPHNSDIPYTQ